MKREVIFTSLIVGASIVIAGRYTPLLFQELVGAVVGGKHAEFVSAILFGAILVLAAVAARALWRRIKGAG